MLSMYPACFYEEKDGYSVMFPDFPGATCGSDMKEAMEMAIDYMAGELYEYTLKKEPFPEPTEINKIEPKKLYGDDYNEVISTITNMVTVDVEEYAKKHFAKSIKKTLTIPMYLNDLAEKENINFSAVLREALENRLNIH